MGQRILIGPPDDANGGYSRLQLGAGEPHVPRTDLSRTITPVSFAFTSFAQMTDLHIVDDQSPLRVEWLDRYGNQGPPHEESYPFRAAYRPHECLSTQVADAMCRNISMIGRGPRTGLPLAFTMVSGDGVDNCQFNEARWYVDVLDGQPITPNSGGSFDHSVTGDSLGLDINYWHPASRDFELSNTKGPASICTSRGASQRPSSCLGLPDSRSRRTGCACRGSLPTATTTRSCRATYPSTAASTGSTSAVPSGST